MKKTLMFLFIFFFSVVSACDNMQSTKDPNVENHPLSLALRSIMETQNITIEIDSTYNDTFELFRIYELDQTIARAREFNLDEELYVYEESYYLEQEDMIDSYSKVHDSDCWNLHTVSRDIDLYEHFFAAMPINLMGIDFSPEWFNEEGSVYTVKDIHLQGVFDLMNIEIQNYQHVVFTIELIDDLIMFTFDIDYGEQTEKATIKYSHIGTTVIDFPELEPCEFLE